LNNENAKREKKREEITNAAFRLFMQKGYASTKIVDIANAVNIGKGTVYEYFKSKEDILLDVIINNVNVEFEYLPKKIAEYDSFDDKLRAYIEFELAFSEKFGKYATEVKQLVVEPVDIKLSKDIQKAIFDLIKLEHSVVFDIVEYGMGGHKIRAMNKMLATHFIVGISSTYAAVKCGLPCSLGLPIPPEFVNDIDNYTIDSIIDIIKNGIGA